MGMNPKYKQSKHEQRDYREKDLCPKPTQSGSEIITGLSLKKVCWVTWQTF